MNFAEYGPALEHTVTADEYMQVLAARLADWEARKPSPPPTGIKPRFPLPPLLEWFIRDEDIPWVIQPQPEPKPPKAQPTPRYYRPASYWRERRDRISAAMSALAAPELPEVAAARGQAIGRKRTARVQQRMDSKLSKYTALDKKLKHAEMMLRAAERREDTTRQNPPHA